MWNKYNATKTEIDGITFDSKAEAKYYEKLKGDKEAGLILDFKLQPRFLLQEGFTKNGIYHRPIYYIADFEVWDSVLKRRIIDVKGVETEVFKIKRKQFELRYPHLSLTIVKGGKEKNEQPKRPKTAEEKEKAAKRRERKAKSKARRAARTRL
ncbi:putative endonuclease [Bacillus phage vB_BcM_Sam46]|uniref:Putative endonuclease n=2 Tax=Caudoviricetes TaxID=2731619 RepID=A0A6G9L9E2_9CAUD|nr:putative endonuclease [Bacillus phage vB_BcM_Sam112]QIQ61276.1 putative endonuclease [Bacillus phage vB_BcM_Sam46]